MRLSLLPSRVLASSPALHLNALFAFRDDLVRKLRVWVRTLAEVDYINSAEDLPECRGRRLHLPQVGRCTAEYLWL